MGAVTNCFRVHMVSTYYIEKTRASHFFKQTVLPPVLLHGFAIMYSCAPKSDPRSSKSYPNLASIITSINSRTQLNSRKCSPITRSISLDGISLQFIVSGLIKQGNWKTRTKQICDATIFHTKWKFKRSKYLNSSKIIVNESIVKKGEPNFFVVRDNTTNWQSQLVYTCIARWDRRKHGSVETNGWLYAETKDWLISWSGYEL